MKLYEHQKKALELVTDNNQFALFMEPGTGKTLVMLYHITNLFMADSIKNALIVCPASVKGSWVRDIEKLSLVRKRYASNITIVSYDMVWRRKEYERQWDCIVLDESHSIAHSSSKRTKFVHKIKKDSLYRYILSGTPMHNGHYEDYWSQIDFIKPNYLGTFKEFKAHYTVERQLPGTYVKIIVRYRNITELLDKIKEVAYYIDKESCLNSLPDKLPPVIIDCELKEKLKYKQATKQFIEEYDMNMGNPLSAISKMRQLCSGFVIDDYGDTHELKCDKPKMLDELLDTFSGKCVIFAEYKYSIDTIKKLLDKKKMSYYVLDGNQRNKSIWRDFQKDDTQCMVCQYRSGNSGIDLFKANNMVFYEPTQSSIVVQQAMDRIHRNGQKNICSYYWLITLDTVEEDIYNRVVNGLDFNTEALESFRKEMR